MKRLLTIAAMIPAILGITPAAFPSTAAEVLDRIVAVVNGHIVLESDWEEALRFESMASSRPLADITEKDRTAALDRLIDQELLSQQLRLSEMPPPSDEAVLKRVEEIRKQYPNASTEDGWQALLARFGLTPDQFKAHTAAELYLLWRIDARLRPTVNVDARSIETYYNQELLPQLRQSGAKEIPLAQVTPKIREILTQQKIDQLLTSWLQSLRSGSTIETRASLSDGKVFAK